MWSSRTDLIQKWIKTQPWYLYSLPVIKEQIICSLWQVCSTSTQLNLPLTALLKWMYGCYGHLTCIALHRRVTSDTQTKSNCCIDFRFRYDNDALQENCDRLLRTPFVFKCSWCWLKIMYTLTTAGRILMTTCSYS
jgi:hypothetical protein